MGQGKSNLNNRPLYDATNFEEFVKISDPRYGEIRPLVHRVMGTNFAAISRVIQQEEDFLKYIGELEIRQQLSHPQLVRLASYNSKKTEEFCSSFYTVGLLYEYWQNSLQVEIGERRKVQAVYREGELWYILDSLINVVAYLQAQQITHGDIRPYNVLLTQTGEIKLGETFKHKQSLSGFSQIVNQQLFEYYVSPQLFRALKTIGTLPQYDLPRSEIYSVGMTVLEAATLENVSDVCYDTDNFEIRQDQVNRLLNQVRSQYSFQLYDILSKILSDNEAERQTPAELLVQLNQPFVQTQKCLNLSLIELVSQSRVVENNNQDEEERVVRSAKPVAVAVEEQTFTPDTNADDLNARIQAVLALSRETIAKYGVVQPITTNPTNVYTTTTTTYPTYVVEQPQLSSARASQVQTRTYLNENTNNIETRNYANLQQYTAPLVSQEPIEEVVKRAGRNYGETSNVASVPQETTYFSSSNQPTFTLNNEVVRQSQAQQALSQNQYTAPVLSYQTTFGANDLQNFNVAPAAGATTTTSYLTNQVLYSLADPTSTNYLTSVAPISSQVNYTVQQQPATTEVTNYTTTTAVNFSSQEERDAYINRIIGDARNQATSASGVNAGNTQITYTNYAEGRPVEQYVSYSNVNGVTY